MKLKRKLDNSAKIFPISTSKKFSTVFRLSANLKENINPKILQKAVNIAIEKYPEFRVKMKFGFFWYYFEQNELEPIVKKEPRYPCKYINPHLNNKYLFTVTYGKKNINIDIFHSLTDANSAGIFFKEIVYSYLELAHSEEFNKEIRTKRKVEEVTTEDSYIENYDKKAKSNASMKKAYIIKGIRSKIGANFVTHNFIDFKGLKEKCKEKNCTVTQYLSAVLIYAIYKENYLKGIVKHNKPIKLCIPVDLRRYYQSKTMTNFFSYITLEAYMKNLTEFDLILDFVKEDYAKKLTQEEILRTMSANVKIGENVFIKIIPLFLKKLFVRLSYLEIRKYTTITYSNIGRVGIIGKYKKFLDYFTMLIAPEPVEKIKCASCTFENTLVFSFCSNIYDHSIEDRFYDFLKEQGIEIRKESK